MERSGPSIETGTGGTPTSEQDLAFAGVAGLAELLRAGELTPRELVELHLRRIERLNPRINALTVLRAEAALAEADEALARLRAGETTPLLGVPVAVKDNVDIAGEVASHGTGAVARRAEADSEVVRRLKAAGAPILGRTAMPELAMWGHMTESRTWGVTRNPWNPGRSTGGSSGGSAAAVAAGLVPAALGSDGGASLRVPAASCGIFGLKPQRGRISLMPHADHWHGLTVLGGLARSVLDAALFDDAVRGPAPGDADSPPPPSTSFAQAARGHPGRLRVAVSLRSATPGIRAGPSARRAVEQTTQLLRSLGHQVREGDPDYGAALPLALPRALAGVAQDADRLEHAERLEARSRRMAAAGRLLRGAPLRLSRGREAATAARVNAVFADHDVLLTPVTAVPPPPAERWRGRGALPTFVASAPLVAYTGIWSYLGQPAAAVPAGFDHEGLPVAVQLVAPPYAETTLLSVAAQLERAGPWADRRPPVS